MQEREVIYVTFILEAHLVVVYFLFYWIAGQQLHGVYVQCLFWNVLAQILTHLKHELQHQVLILGPQNDTLFEQWSNTAVQTKQNPSEKLKNINVDIISCEQDAIQQQ